MTDYDPKPIPVHQQERLDDDGSSIWKWLIPLLLIGAAIIAAFIFFDVDKTEDGAFDVDVNAELPEYDVDAADIDVDLPEVTLPEVSIEGGDISGGDIDVDLPNEGAEADDISDLDGETMDGNVDLGMDGNEPQGGDLPENLDED